MISRSITGRRRTIAGRLLLVAAALPQIIITGCSGEASAPPLPTISSLKIVTGDQQTGTVGAALAAPIVLVALDKADRPMPGIVVSFLPTAGGGSVSATRDTSNALGQVVTQWTLGTVAGDPQTLTATVIDSVGATTAIVPVVLSAAATAGSRSALTATPSSVSGRVGAPLDSSISVMMRDAYGNRVRAAGVFVTARYQGADQTTLTNTLGARTDSAGVATLTGLTIIGHSGPGTILIESDGVVSARVALTLGSGPATQVEVSGTAAVQAFARTAGPPISARISDAWNNPVAGTDVEFSIDGIGAIGHANSTATGIATLASWTAPAIGSYRITATVAGISSLAQFALVTQPGPPAVITTVPSSPTFGTAGSELTLSVFAVDASGGPATDAVLQWALTGGATGVAATNIDGIATFTARLPQKIGNVDVVVRAGQASLAINVRVLAGRPYRVIPSVDSLSAPAGSTVPIAFTVQDEFGNPIDKIPLTAHGGTSAQVMTPTSVVTGSDGVARFNATTDPYAEPQYFRVTYDLPPFLSGGMMISATASRGTLRVNTLGSCSLPTGNASTTLPVFVYASNGKPASGVSATFSVPSGSGYLYHNGAPSVHLQTVSEPTSASGVAGVWWVSPGTQGDFAITVTTPAGYDALSPGTIVCHVRP